MVRSGREYGGPESAGLKAFSVYTFSICSYRILPLTGTIRFVLLLAAREVEFDQGIGCRRP